MAAITWSGGGSDNLWSTPANWVGGVPPVDGDSVIFSGSNRKTNVNDLTADINIAGITFNGADWFLSGNRITLTGNVANSGGNNCHIGFDIITTAVRTFNCGFQLHVEGIISGTGGGVTKTGASTIFLYADNTCTGAATLTAGSMHLYGSNAFSTASINGGTSSQLYLYKTDSAGSNTIGFSTGATTPICNIRIDGGGTINMAAYPSGNSSVSGTINVNNNGSGTNGVVTFPDFSAGNASYTISGGNGYSVRFTQMRITGGSAGTATITANADCSIGTVTQTFNAAHTLALAGTATGCSITGIISNGIASALSITKAGTGTWTLSGTNTYTGTKGISAGRLVFSGNQASTNGNTTVSGGVMECATPASIPGTSRNVTLTFPGMLVFGAGGFTAAEIATALLGRVVAASSGVVAGCNYASTDFNFQAAGLTAAFFGCENDLTYSGTLTANTTAGYRFYTPATKTITLSNILAGTTTDLRCEGAGTVVFNGSGNNSFGNVTVGTSVSGIAVTVTANGSFTCGTGAHALLVGSSGFTGTLNLSAATATTINVTTIILGNGASTNSNGTLNLGNNTTITASTGFYVAGNAQGNLGTGCVGLVTTAASSTVTISTPEIIVGRNKTPTGTFTSGSSSNVTIQGTSGGRCALDVGRQEADVGGPGRWAVGTMDFSAGVVSLYLSQLRIGIDVSATTTGNAGTGTVIIGTSASNHIDISGPGSPVIVGYHTSVATTDLDSGTLTIGNCDATSQIVSTDNSTAIMLGTKGGSTLSPLGTLNLGGNLTITTTGTAIGRNGGTANVTVTNTCTLKAGAASTTWINDLSYFKINSGVTLTIDSDSNDITIPQIIADGTGSGAVTKAGTGTLTLSGINTYSGDTTLSGGTIKYGVATAIPSGAGKGNVILNPTSGTTTLDTNGFSPTINGLSSSGAGASVVDNSVAGSYTLTVGANDQNGTFSGVISNTAGTLAITKTGAGILVLDGASTYTGDTTINDGAVTLGSGGVVGSLSPSSAIVNNSTFAVNRVNTTIQGTDFSAGISGTGKVVNVGAGTLELSGSNSYTGQSAAAAGKITFDSIANVGGGVSALGAPTTVAGGTLQLGDGTATAAFEYTGPAVTTDRVINLAGTTGSVSLTQSGYGGLLKFTGGVTAGTAGAKTLTLDGSTAGEIDGAIVNSVGGATSLIKAGSGAGSWTLSGTSTYTGSTTVTTGTLYVTGALGATAVTVQAAASLKGTGSIAGAITANSTGIVGPGLAGTAIGQLTTADVTLSLGSVYSVDLDGVTPTFDKINSSGTVSLAGTLTVASYTNPAVGKVFTIIGATTRSGTFNGLADGATFSAAGRTLQVNYTGTTAILTDVTSGGYKKYRFMPFFPSP